MEYNISSYSLYVVRIQIKGKKIIKNKNVISVNEKAIN